MFQFHVKSDSYLGTDIVQDIMLTVEDASKLQEKIVEEIIPEADEEGTHPLKFSFRFHFFRC